MHWHVITWCKKYIRLQLIGNLNLWQANDCKCQLMQDNNTFPALIVLEWNPTRLDWSWMIGIKMNEIVHGHLSWMIFNKAWLAWNKSKQVLFCIGWYHVVFNSHQANTDKDRHDFQSERQMHCIKRYWILLTKDTDVDWNCNRTKYISDFYASNNFHFSIFQSQWPH